MCEHQLINCEIHGRLKIAPTSCGFIINSLNYAVGVNCVRPQLSALGGQHMTTYPLMLKPALKSSLWGGTRLIKEFGYSGKDIVAEAWVLSCRADGAAIIQNGALKGTALSDAIALWGNDALGKRAASSPQFPLLIKLIDARDKLSVQVHPDNDYALRVEGEPGKTEMWYVVDCNPGAELIYGFNRDLTKDEFRRHIENGSLLEVCNFVPVKKGDVFFIEAGTLHAIGGGILIAEVQQNSDITYRVYDYDRRDSSGNPRQLHIQKAVDVTNTSTPNHQKTLNTETIDGGTIKTLAQCEYFTCCLLTVNSAITINNLDSFCSLLNLEGECTLETENANLILKKGSSIFLPAGMGAHITSTAKQPAKILYSYI